MAPRSPDRLCRSVHHKRLPFTTDTADLPICPPQSATVRRSSGWFAADGSSSPSYRSGHPGPGAYLGRQMCHRMANRMTAEAAVWHAMFVEQIPLTEKILRTVIVYALIAVLFRLTGKRGLASMNTFDVIVIFLLSNVVQNAVIGNDTSLTGGVIGAVTLVTVNAAVNRLIAASTTAARIFDGRATTVISDD